MDLSPITPDAVKQALDLVRRAEPLKGNPLLDLACLRARLRADGVSVNPTTLEWGFGGLLHDLITRQLRLLRGPEDPRPSGNPSPSDHLRPADQLTLAQEKALLAKDFAAGSIDREAWSSLYYRYVAGLGLQEQAIAAIAKPGYEHADRHIRRRLTRGYTLVANHLRDLERTASREADRLPGAPAHLRVLVEAPAAAETTVPSAAAEPSASSLLAPRTLAETSADLVAAVRDDSRVVVLPPDQARAIAQAPAANWQAYRAGRIAEWSQPRYRLDTRFIGLTLLIDQGRASQGERWRATPQPFQDLGAVLDAVPDPALVVLGPPGAGKSSLLRRFELDAAIVGLRGEGERSTFFASLSAYRPPQPGADPPPPLDWLATQWQARYPDLPPLDAVLAEGRMVLLLDALNELPQAGPADFHIQVGRWKQFVQTIAATRPGNRIVFSCRSLDYSAPLSTPELPVPQVRIEPLTDDQIRRFLALHHPTGADALWRALAETGRLDLLRLPFFLKLMLDELGATGELPAGRAALFTGFVRQALSRELDRDNPRLAPDRLLTERDRRRIVRNAWPTPYALPEHGRLLPTLADLAYRMQARQSTGEAAQVRVDYDTALALLDDSQGEDILRVGLDLGVLDEDTPREEILFFHQLLQEYFAARRLAAAPEPDRVRAVWRTADVAPTLAEAITRLAPSDSLPPLPSTGWEETAILAAAMAADPDAFIRGLADANLPVAARAAAQPEARVGETLKSELRQALVGRTRDPATDLRARIAAGLALGELGDPRFERGSGPDGDHLLPPLVDVPGGDYPIGAAADHRVTLAPFRLPPFRIGRFPVTNAEWACFITAGGYDDPRWWDGEAAAAWRDGTRAAEGARWNYREWLRRFRADPALLDRMRAEGRIPEPVFEAWQARLAMDDAAFEAHLAADWPAGRRTAPEMWHDTRFNRPSQPVVGVSWFEARAYCLWLAAQSGVPVRLPSEAEWEAAARGLDGRRHAWGDDFDPARCNAVDTHVRRPTPVGVFPDGDTPEGAADMTGNVWEWTASLWGADAEAPAFGHPYRPDDGREDPHAPDGVLRVARGGSWLNHRDLLDAGYRYPFHPGHRNELYGLRLASAVG